MCSSNRPDFRWFAMASALLSSDEQMTFLNKFKMYRVLAKLDAIYIVEQLEDRKLNYHYH